LGATLIHDAFSNAVQGAVSGWRAGKTLHVACNELADPVSLGAELGAVVREELERDGVDIVALRDQAWQGSFLHLRGVFAAAELPSTPVGFLPIPDVEGTLLARASSIAALAAIGLDTISYGSENNGELFVNLVIIPGDGDFAEKSRDSMHGHTDAVSFPIRGRHDAEESRIAPSPDFVCLSGLRNPTAAQTTVMPLADILAQLTQDQIAELKKPQFLIRSQRTFREGTKRILGDELVVDGGELLFDVDGQLWIRFSHRSAGADDTNSVADDAVEAFKAACTACATGIVIGPGDILLVNNRVGLHGRTIVDGEPGGESRWLLRTYGLVTENLNADQRYRASPHKLFP